MRIEYNEYYGCVMYPESDYEFKIMYRIRKEIFEIDLIYSYEYYRKNGINLAFTYETELIMIIEKMKNDRIERILQLRNKDKYVRFVARVMLEVWR